MESPLRGQTALRAAVLASRAHCDARFAGKLENGKPASRARRAALPAAQRDPETTLTHLTRASATPAFCRRTADDDTRLTVLNSSLLATSLRRRRLLRNGLARSNASTHNALTNIIRSPQRSPHRRPHSPRQRHRLLGPSNASHCELSSARRSRPVCGSRAQIDPRRSRTDSIAAPGSAETRRPHLFQHRQHVRRRRRASHGAPRSSLISACPWPISSSTDCGSWHVECHPTRRRCSRQHRRRAWQRREASPAAVARVARGHSSPLCPACHSRRRRRRRCARCRPRSHSVPFSSCEEACENTLNSLDCSWRLPARYAFSRASSTARISAHKARRALALSQHQIAHILSAIVKSPCRAAEQGDLTCGVARSTSQQRARLRALPNTSFETS